MDIIRVKSPAKKHIALIAHDGMKQDLLAWVSYNQETLSRHHLYATASTGTLIRDATGLTITSLQSGPLGGDLQIGARIVEGRIDFLVFFWDPLQPQPHDPDVKALLRVAVLHNIPTASNRATADFLISSELMEKEYVRLIPDYLARIRREQEE
jgi:methylglyoxal synthase